MYTKNCNKILFEGMNIEKLNLSPEREFLYHHAAINKIIRKCKNAETQYSPKSKTGEYPSIFEEDKSELEIRYSILILQVQREGVFIEFREIRP